MLSDGALSGLRRLVRAELQARFGSEVVQIFQDVAAIPHGISWEEAIRNAISCSNFFIPIVSPRFFQSEWCWKELRLFLEASDANSLGHRLIFPIKLIDTDGVEALDKDGENFLQTIQYFDFSSFRHRSFESPEVRQAIATFASDIFDALRHPSPRKPATIPASNVSPQLPQQAKIFISYSAQERESAAMLASALEGAGYSVWWDRELDTGERYGDVIEAVINESKAALVLWSQSSIRSDWVRSEARRAHRKGIYLPLTLDGTEPPLGLDEQHCTSLQNWDGKPEHQLVQSIIRAVARRAGSQQ
jgi:hypothetical protein